MDYRFVLEYDTPRELQNTAAELVSPNYTFTGRVRSHAQTYGVLVWEFDFVADTPSIVHLIRIILGGYTLEEIDLCDPHRPRC